MISNVTTVIPTGLLVQVGPVGPGQLTLQGFFRLGSVAPTTLSFKPGLAVPPTVSGKLGLILSGVGATGP